MSILKHLFSKDINKEFLSENKDLENIKYEIEHYLYYLYEKVSILIEIKNKFYDIKNRKAGFIQEDEKNFMKKNRNVEDFGVSYEDKNKHYYYKGWVNRRLKRVRKILLLELKAKDGGVLVTKKDISKTIRILNESLNQELVGKENQELKVFVEKLEILNKNLIKQISIIEELYPISNWDEDVHENLISQDLLILIGNEIKILFDESVDISNFNIFPGLISRKIHESQIPINSTLNNLIQKNIQKVKENKKEEKLELVKCYHARPKQITKELLPLELKTKSTGFFVDMNKEEAINIVSSLYDISKMEVEVFEITIPRNLFKYAVKDNFDDSAFKTFEMVDSYIFKPTVFPRFNEFYLKGLITCKKLTLK